MNSRPDEELDSMPLLGHLTELRLEEGKRYRLTLTMNPRGPAGKHLGMIRLMTSSTHLPGFELGVSTELKAGVRTLSEEVNFGVLPLRLLREEPPLVRRLTRTLIVRCEGKPDLAAEFRSDLPFLDAKWQRSGSGNSYEAQI